MPRLLRQEQIKTTALIVFLLSLNNSVFTGINLEAYLEPTNPIAPNAPFLYPLKTSENCKRVEKECIGNKKVKVLNAP